MTEENHELINFNEIREQKQLQSDNAICDFYNQYFFFVNRYTNIREKVRASHLFKELVNLPHEAPLSDSHEQLFFQWFAFEYVTIQGKTLLQLFLADQAKQKTESFLIQGAFFLTSVLEPIIVSKVPNSFFLKGYTPLTNEQVIIKDVRGRFANLEEQQVIWIRKIKSIGYDVLIDSFFLGHKQRIEQLVTQYNDKKNAMTWRSFLKQQAIYYVRKPK
ncbi:nicotinate phosphoribosyltransferase [Priestia megaterium]|uniref:nicotinate phosphoribosyltransferase n=1 Tax=Priestia megaterium TaxID=1404 RepID=UPI00300991BA